MSFNKSILLVLFLSFFASAFADEDELREMQNKAFKRGEFLKYRVFYDSWLTSWMSAGTGTVQVLEENKKFHGRDTYHMVVEGNSAGPFNWFFKVRDRFESYVDEQALIPWKFIRKTREGDFSKDDTVIFNHYENRAKSLYLERSIPPNTHDIVSAFYMMRNLDVSNIKVNDELFVKFMLDDSVYNSKVIYLGKEVVDVKAGTFNALKFKPMVATGEVFDEQYPMTLWVTDDPNHIPLKIKSAVIIGSVTIELVEYENLMHPLKSRLKD